MINLSCIHVLLKRDLITKQVQSRFCRNKYHREGREKMKSDNSHWWTVIG